MNIQNLRNLPAAAVLPLESTVKKSFITRHVNFSDVYGLTNRVSPKSGDLAVATVEKIAQHTKVQLVSGRRSQLYVGDEILVAYGNRYAPDCFEALVPDHLDKCHLITAGGVASVAITKHSALKMPTSIQPVGLLTNQQGGVINLAQYALQLPKDAEQKSIPVIAIVGTSMNSGKTTAAASLTHGLSRAGLSVAAIKATGTGSGNDVWALEDAGADLVLDFTDAGYPSTYKLSDKKVEDIFNLLIGSAKAASVDVVVVEVADGLLHQESATLIESEAFRNQIGGVLFCAGDAMGAVSGIEWLEKRGVSVLGVSGALTASHLGVLEAQRGTGVRIYDKPTLCCPSILTLLEFLEE